MKIHLVCLRREAYDAMLHAYASAEPKLHTLVDDPEVADMIVFVGGWDHGGKGLVDNPLPRKYPEKCFQYSDDVFLPLLPGVYTSATKPLFFDLKRFKGAVYINRFNTSIKPIEIEKKYLFTFAGGSTAMVRKRLYNAKFKRSDVLIQNTSNYYHWDPSQAGREERQKQYATTIAESKYALCPRGSRLGSIRLFEVMEMGVAPVLLADGFIPPEGPDWESFMLTIPETQLKNLESVVEQHENEFIERGRLARKAYEEFYAPRVVFNDVIGAIERVRDEKKISERWVQPFWGFMIWRMHFKDRLRSSLRAAVLTVYRLLGKKLPYAMNTR